MIPESTVERTGAPRTGALTAELREAASLAPLWVGGVALLCLIPGYLLTPVLTALSPRAGVWAQYLALGTLYPALLAALVLLDRSGRRLPWQVTCLLSVIPIVAMSVLAGPAHSVAAVGLAAVQTAVSVAIGSRNTRPTVSRMAPHLIVAYLGWAAVLEVLTWDALAVAMPIGLPLVLAVIIAVVVCSWWMFGAQRAATGRWQRLDAPLAACCVVLLVLLAFRTDGLFITDRLGASGTFYHWGALVGPAEVVRQGGWPLWDTPAPYGFLSTLTLAAFPASTAWQSLYLLNAAATALLAVWLFFALRAIKPGVIGSLLAAAGSAAAVFFLPVWPPDLMPEYYVPMSGAFRYGWVYVLAGVLIYERHLAPGSRWHRLLLAAGCLIWLIAMFWSSEMAFAASATWLPAFALIGLRDHGILSGARSWKGLAAWLSLPPLLLAIALAALVAIYRVALGRGPDLFAYVETVLTFSGSEFGARTGMYEGLGPNRTIVVLLFAFLLLAMAGTAVSLSGRHLRSLPALLGTSLGLWGLASYPVGLAVPYTFFRFLPFVLLGLAFALVAAPSAAAQRWPTWNLTLRAGAIPLVAAILVTVYTNLSAFQYYAEAIRQEAFLGRDVTAGMPFVEPQLERLMQEASVSATDPILYAGARFGDTMPRWTPAGASEPVVVSKQWLAGPLSVIAHRPEDRKQTYMQRRAARQQLGGWLIERQTKDGLIVTTGPWFFTQLAQSFIPLKIAENDDWRLIWFEPRSSWPASFGEGIPDGEAPSLPSDLSVNGRPLAGRVVPPVWGYFGPEWISGGRSKAWRCASGRGTITFFVPSPRHAELAFKVARDVGPVRVALNGGPSVATEQDPGGQVVAPLALAAGWNDIAIDPEDASKVVSGKATELRYCGAGHESSWSLRIHTVDFRVDAS